VGLLERREVPATRGRLPALDLRERALHDRARHVDELLREVEVRERRAQAIACRDHVVEHPLLLVQPLEGRQSERLMVSVTQKIDVMASTRSTASDVSVQTSNFSASQASKPI